MPPEEHTTLQDLRRLLPASFLAGLVAGGLLALLTHVHAWCWGGIACYNPGLPFDFLRCFTPQKYPEWEEWSLTVGVYL